MMKINSLIHIINLVYRKLKLFFTKLSKENIIFILFIFFAFIIVIKTFSYTVLNYTYYKELADKQQIWKISIPVTRWNIYSYNNTVLATSVNKNNLAIDPTVKGNMNKLLNYLSELVYHELCNQNISTKKCYDSLLSFLREESIKNFTNDEKIIKDLILSYLKKILLSDNKLTSVLLEENLREDLILELRKFDLKWIYIKDKNVFANPEEIENIESTALVLARIFNKREVLFKDLLRPREKKYIAIIKKLSIDSWEKLKSFIKDEKEAIKKWFTKEEESISNFIILEATPQRYYPEKWMAGQLIWFLDSSWIGHYWLEWYFNSILKWNNWFIISKKDIKWRIIDPISLQTSDFNLEWAKIFTSIDRNIQKKVEEILENWVIKYQANKWTVIVMNPKTWKILAMANYPTYDPNNPGDVYELEKISRDAYKDILNDLKWITIFVVDTKEWKKFLYDWENIFLREAKEEEIIDNAIVKYKYKNNFWPWIYNNDAISWLYEPWSIMKAMTLAIWIDSWEIKVNDTYTDLENKIQIWNFEIKNVAKECIGEYLTFAHAFNYSCNVWMIRIAQKYGPAISYEYLNNFWFSQKTWISLEWEVNSSVKNFLDWSKAELFTKSYWLWISVSPLQMTLAYSILANWWVYIKANLIDRIEFPDWKIIKYNPEMWRRVIKESTSKIMIDLLQDSVENWVAKIWAVKWYNIWWKTWTAQIASKWIYEKWVASTNASFVWFWPVENPEFIIFVRLERPRTSEYWALTSWNLFHDISEYILNYYEIPKSKS